MGRELYNINWINLYLRDGSTCGNPIEMGIIVTGNTELTSSQNRSTNHSKIKLFVENHGLQALSLALLAGSFQQQTIFVGNMPSGCVRAYALCHLCLWTLCNLCPSSPKPEDPQQKPHLSHEKNLFVEAIQGIILPNYIGIIINHYKDPYKPTRIQWKVVSGFFSLLTSSISFPSRLLNLTGGVFGINADMAVYPFAYHVPLASEEKPTRERHPGPTWSNFRSDYYWKSHVGGILVARKRWKVQRVWIHMQIRYISMCFNFSISWNVRG